MSKHTPGPWVVGTPPPNGEQTIGTHQGLMVAVATTGVGVDSIANARLIAAAPELLSTLHSVEALLDSLWTATVTSASGREQNKQLKKLALEQVRSAIAKAEGTASKSLPARGGE